MLLILHILIAQEVAEMQIVSFLTTIADMGMPAKPYCGKQDNADAVEDN